MTSPSRTALDGEYDESEIPLLLTRRGMVEWTGDSVRLLDRRCLPTNVRFIECRDVEDVARAIETMAIQGAFTLSLAAGYGMALAMRTADWRAREPHPIRAGARRLLATRPTGLALARMVAACEASMAQARTRGEDAVDAIVRTVDARAARLARQALATARHALPLLMESDAILTHCFADRSLLYLLLEAKRSGKAMHVYCSETRPYLQGARLTAPAVKEIGHRATVVTDGMGGFLMRRGLAQALVTAADRVCLDGTVCNKVGTYQYALAARANGVPYYVLRQSGPDKESADEAHVEIEFRDGDQVLDFMGIRTTSDGVDGLYPAFDITPAELVTAIVTDRGIFDPRVIADYLRRAASSTPEIVK